MCNVKEPLVDVEEVVGYKVVKHLNNGIYYSLFAGFKIELGPVKIDKDQHRPWFSREYNPTRLNRDGEVVVDRLYNPAIAEGRTTVFAKKEDAMKLWCPSVWKIANSVHTKILKIKLRGGLMHGTAAGINPEVFTGEEIVYAGKEIVSFELLKPSEEEWLEARTAVDAFKEAYRTAQKRIKERMESYKNKSI
jgi:hypothetical protein